LAHDDQPNPLGQAVDPDALGFVGENLNRLEAHRVVLVDRSHADHAGVVQGQHRRRY
jgi:hypothetical protein